MLGLEVFDYVLASYFFIYKKPPGKGGFLLIDQHLNPACFKRECRRKVLLIIVLALPSCSGRECFHALSCASAGK